MEHLVARFSGDVHPGDVFIVNDPDEGGMHLPDVFLIKPVFFAGTLGGYVACVAHYPDIGGRVAGGNAFDSTDIFQEGLQIPLIKLYDRGRLDESFLRVLLRNVRIPDVVHGDLQAQLAACHVGESGLLELHGRYGTEGLERRMKDVLAYTEQRIVNELRRLPEGHYSFVDYIDDDGFGSGPIAIEVALHLAGGRLEADFSGTSPQVRSALNATMSFTKAAVYAAVRCVVSDDIPSNSGFYRPIEVRAPRGSILNPERPAPRAARGLTGYRTFDTVLAAFAQICPDRVPAAGDGGASMIAITGQHRGGEPFILVDFMTGGWGARPDADGPDGNSPIAANLSNVPIEDIEARFPIRVQRYGLVADTGGAGRFRGSLSVEREYRLVGVDGLLQVRSDRQHHLPGGLGGGAAGSPSANVLDPDTPGCTRLAGNVVVPISAGQVFRHVTAGGGGFGPAAERDRQLVAEDVLDGKLTPQHAARAYGLVLGAAAGEVAVGQPRVGQTPAGTTPADQSPADQSPAGTTLPCQPPAVPATVRAGGDSPTSAGRPAR
ncbi:MAG TPA: hydantoinase B/oxoprolinase family protein, partial [Acidimicrobiales bacterium]|nr:hydantoinase B/oxoprolinase family protein [Acidimicrobiales bacterium]